jgi:hypothetical protein
LDRADTIRQNSEAGRDFHSPGSHLYSTNKLALSVTCFSITKVASVTHLLIASEGRKNSVNIPLNPHPLRNSHDHGNCNKGCRRAQANAKAVRAIIEPDLSSCIQSPARGRSRALQAGGAGRGRPSVARRCIDPVSLQNWKRKPTVGSIEDLCRKPFARPFDTCDHMMPA